MYYGARYYDAALGRFTQPDTIVPNPYNPQDLNRYTYTRNNPLRYTDPSGRVCVPCLVGVLAIIALFPGDTGSYPLDPVGNTISDLILRITVEPYDRARTLQDCAMGQCSWLDGAGLLPGIPGGMGIVTRAVSPNAKKFVESAAKIADKAVKTRGMEGALDAARKAARKGDEILPGLFKYDPVPAKKIEGYQQHHLWPKAMGGPEDGWTVYAQDPHTSGIQMRLNNHLTEITGMRQRELEEWARENPEDLLPYLREFYKNEGIDFPY